MIEFGLMELGPSIGDLPGLQSFEEEIQQLQQDGLLDLTDTHELPSVTGIEATDMGSLLEQFEEASQTLADCDALTPTLGLPSKESEVIDVVTPETTEGTSKSEEVDETPKKDLLKKIKAGCKRKATILLPMGMPSKRGRGRATAMPANCAPPKLQRIMKDNKSTTIQLTLSQTSTDTQPVITVNNEKLKPSVSLLQTGASSSSQNRLSLLGNLNLLKNQSQNSNVISHSVVVTNSSYISADHSYCQTLPKLNTESVAPEPSQEALETENESEKSTNVVKLDSCNLEDSEGVEVLVTKKQEDNNDSKAEANKPSNRFLSYQERLKQSKARRQYRRQRGESPETALDEEKYFDKIPAYYTALSIPSKQRKKPKENGTTAVNRAGITREDFFERNPSPPRDPTVFNKLPAYYSCFTNSTKYDSSSTPGCGLESDKTISPDNSLDGSRVSSSGYSSRSHSPLMDSKRCSRSRSRSRSSSSSSSMSRSRSRSHSRSRSRGRKRSWQRERKSSYSSHSRSSSRSSYSSRSSRSRSRSLSSDYSYSSSRSRSRSRSKSQEMRRVQQKERRKEEKSKQMEERRIVYVGRIPNKYTRHDMKKRFGRFGDIDHVQLHFREHGDNYGFVTFAYTCDAYAAVEKGNDIKGEPVFDLCFGGRRQFCETEYEDLDGEIEIMEEFCPLPKKSVDVDFDELLKQAQKKIQSK